MKKKYYIKDIEGLLLYTGEKTASEHLEDHHFADNIFQAMPFNSHEKAESCILSFKFPTYYALEITIVYI